MAATAAVAATEEEWMELAARDDRLVADLLLRLCRSAANHPRSSRKPAPLLDWSVRQPRSGGPARKKEKEKDESGAEPERASPTTPLSWSCATSTSGGGEAQEESSRPVPPPYSARSKVSCFSASANSTIQTTKRPKRKKTLAELKEEESLLLKERRNLRNELSTLLLTAERERAQNEILKRKKLDMQLHHKATITARNMKADNEPLEVLPQGRGYINVVTQQNPPPGNVSAAKGEMTMFELPDLNLPLEEHSRPEILYGAR